MFPAPKPVNEAERLAALLRLRILDTPAEERFDRITRIAKRVFNAPISLLSLLDAERQWVKSRQGEEVPETSRDHSFCGHAILGAAPLIVRDALRDPRFSDNPLVLTGPLVRFYAGVPVCSPDGAHVGTLCIMDRRPRDLAAGDLALLQDLAALVDRELGRVA